MFFEGQQRIGLLVFGADREDDAALTQFERKPLDRDMRFADSTAVAEDDAFHPIIADQSPPERVVEIENQAFARLAPCRTDDATDMVGIERRHVLARRASWRRARGARHANGPRPAVEAIWAMSTIRSPRARTEGSRALKAVIIARDKALDLRVEAAEERTHRRHEIERSRQHRSARGHPWQAAPPVGWHGRLQTYRRLRPTSADQARRTSHPAPIVRNRPRLCGDPPLHPVRPVPPAHKARSGARSGRDGGGRWQPANRRYSRGCGSRSARAEPEEIVLSRDFIPVTGHHLSELPELAEDRWTGRKAAAMSPHRAPYRAADALLRGNPQMAARARANACGLFPFPFFTGSAQLSGGRVDQFAGVLKPFDLARRKSNAKSLFHRNDETNVAQAVPLFDIVLRLGYPSTRCFPHRKHLSSAQRGG